MSEFGLAWAPAPPKPVNAATGEGAKAPKMDSLLPRMLAAGRAKASFPNSRLVNIVSPRIAAIAVRRLRAVDDNRAGTLKVECPG